MQESAADNASSSRPLMPQNCLSCGLRKKTISVTPAIEKSDTKTDNQIPHGGNAT